MDEAGAAAHLAGRKRVGTPDIESSFAEMKANGIDAGRLQHLSRNFEHPEGWTQPSFKLCAPAAGDIEGLMHVVVIQHLTPELLRRPEFLAHENSCVGVNAIAGAIYDKRRAADKLRRLLGDGAVTEEVDGVRAVLASGQRLELLVPIEFERKYGALPEPPEPETPRLGNLTLRVASLDALHDALRAGRIDFEERSGGQVAVAPEHACGATLLFTESPPA